MPLKINQINFLNGCCLKVGIKQSYVIIQQMKELHKKQKHIVMLLIFTYKELHFKCSLKKTHF